MHIIQGATQSAKPNLSKKFLGSLLSLALFAAASPQSLPAAQEQDPQQQQDSQQAPPQTSKGAPYAQQSPEQLQQLVAPIALYPDSLVAQVLAAATFPEQVVEADRWVQAHPDLHGDALAQAVDQEPWDPSVKALAAFPSVLGNLDKNLSWTSSLGDAYYNQEQDVMDAVQFMRQKAESAGNLKSTQQQVVTTQGSTVIIEPAQPDVVYVPAYNPWVVYGYPVAAWPGWYPYPGIWYGGPYLSFGIGFGIGWYGGYGWGWNRWGFDWHNHYAVYNHNRYYSQSRTFYNRNVYYRGGNGRNGNARGEFARGGNARGDRPPGAGSGRPGGVYNRSNVTSRPFEGNRNAARGYAPRGGQSGVRSGVYSGYDHGGEARSYSSRGNSSLGGGSHAGGGGAPRGGGGGAPRGGGGPHH